MKYSPVLFFLVLLFLSGCEPRESIKSPSQSGANNAANNIKPNVPIYESFDDLEYIFKYENDTTYVINFWATWCKPCVKELPYFDKLYDEYQDEKVRIILVSLDFPKQIESKLIPYIMKNNLKPEVMLLTDGNANAWLGRVDKQWDGAIPITLIYNKKERDFVFGDVSNYEELKSRVDPLININ